MNWFSAGSVSRVFVVSLNQGDYLLESAKDFIHEMKIKNGVIISAIGTLDYCTLHMVTTTGYPPVEHFQSWADTALELSSMSGFIADGEPHLHAVISDKNVAYSGHVEEKCRILYLAEIVIMELKGTELCRVRNEKGINLLKAK